VARAQDTCGDTGFTDDDVASALSAALGARGVSGGGGDVDVSCEGGQFHYGVRLSETAKPASSTQAAPLQLVGTVQVVEDQVRVTAQIELAETGEIVEAAEGDASGRTRDAITDAAQTAFAGLRSLNQ
jgi:hypothetical protein